MTPRSAPNAPTSRSGSNVGGDQHRLTRPRDTCRRVFRAGRGRRKHPTTSNTRRLAMAGSAMRYDERPADHTPIHTDDLPPTPVRDRNIVATAWVEAPADLLKLGDDIRADRQPSTSAASAHGSSGGPDRHRAATLATGRPGAPISTTPSPSVCTRTVRRAARVRAAPRTPLPVVEGRPPRPLKPPPSTSSA